jgi:hypothetical protein
LKKFLGAAVNIENDRKKERKREKEREREGLPCIIYDTKVMTMLLRQRL